MRDDGGTLGATPVATRHAGIGVFETRSNLGLKIANTGG
jgi:hypothetical protein